MYRSCLALRFDSPDDCLRRRSIVWGAKAKPPVLLLFAPAALL